MYVAFISEMEQMPWDEAYLKQHRRSLGSRPEIGRASCRERVLIQV